ncbi:hypothetical protein PoB_001374900 [Plakobranchus ocellatus]|uniref:PiggyBac transposable element-derived protein domain-containing protein n=1 Tax=Plakobranchus ocellatus TaxID=259542 RepID=A0AAV3YYP9_9GAST|nr:hypothetical protein PoB_001374900 [Plakobranchus ocellatus]
MTLNALDIVNALLSNMKTKSKEIFHLHENLSTDEAMTKCHRKQSGVGAPSKLAKRGHKIYTLADGHTGYIWDIETATHNNICLDASTQREGSTTESFSPISFSGQPVISTPARLRRSPRKLKFCER